MDIKESDWKVFRKLHKIALERFCERLLKEVRRTIDGKGSQHERYLKLSALLHRRTKAMAAAFNGARRSRATILLSNIIDEGLLTDKELDEFSAELRQQIETIRSIRRS